jgi:hypothetical protein
VPVQSKNNDQRRRFAIRHSDQGNHFFGRRFLDVLDRIDQIRREVAGAEQPTPAEPTTPATPMEPTARAEPTAPAIRSRRQNN